MHKPYNIPTVLCLLLLTTLIGCAKEYQIGEPTAYQPEDPQTYYRVHGYDLPLRYPEFGPTPSYNEQYGGYGK